MYWCLLIFNKKPGKSRREYFRRKNKINEPNKVRLLGRISSSVFVLDYASFFASDERFLLKNIPSL